MSRPIGNPLTGDEIPISLDSPRRVALGSETWDCMNLNGFELCGALGNGPGELLLAAGEMAGAEGDRGP
ncbi:MAG: hypothetical protein WB341_05845 [Terracidiphilus sp.]